MAPPTRRRRHLSAHLDAALLRGLGRLKVLAVIPAPDVIPSYLVPANW
jgi:hypothetical protein